LRLEALEGRCVPATITPTTFADGGLGSGSLRDAVLQFNADTGTEDDIIQLLPGTYSLTIRNAANRHETAGLTGDLNLNQTSHRWIIQGAGPSTVIDASQLQDRVFQIVHPGTQVVFQDFVIEGGLAQEDGTDGAVARTTDALGGGILNNGGDVGLDNVVLQNNVAQGGSGTIGFSGYRARGGGLYSADGVLSISQGSVANNEARGGRGSDAGVRFVGTEPIYYGAGSGGDAQGGGMYSTGAALTISDSTLSANQATGGRGGSGISAAYAGSFGEAGGAAQGGGLYATGGVLSFANSTATANMLRGGDGGDGGAVLAFGGDGGASQGGGLYVGGALTASNSTISANALRGGNGGGAGAGGNGGPGLGAGLWVASGATAQVSFTTIAANQSTGGTHGSGRTNGSDGPATGAGFYNQGTLETRETILAGNMVSGPGTNSSADLAGNLGSLGYNLIGNSQGGSGFDPSDLLDVDPLLGPLQDNGGPTQTMALLPGSPALTAGDPNQLGTADQRGVVRSGGVNIGAYQASATAFVLSAPEMAQSGVPFDVTVTAVDPFGQVAVGYTGSVTFSSSDTDPGVVLPADYPFTLADGGMHTFAAGVTLITPGDQTLTVSDTADSTLTGSATVTVGSPALGSNPSGLGPPPPSSSPANLAPAPPPPSRAPSDLELFAGDGWRASAPEGISGWAPAFRLRHPVGGQPEAWLADLGPPEDQRGAGG
jgi:hypothetical protein